MCLCLSRFYRGCLVLCVLCLFQFQWYALRVKSWQHSGVNASASSSYSTFRASISNDCLNCLYIAFRYHFPHRTLDKDDIPWSKCLPKKALSDLQENIIKLKCYKTHWPYLMPRTLPFYPAYYDTLQIYMFGLETSARKSSRCTVLSADWFWFTDNSIQTKTHNKVVLINCWVLLAYTGLYHLSVCK